MDHYTDEPKTLEDAKVEIRALRERLVALTDPTLFSSVIRELERGLLDPDLGERMGRIVDAVRTQGKPAVLSLKLDVKPVAGNDGLATVIATPGERLPKPDRAPSNFYITREGTLSRDHPSQLTHPALQPRNENR
jgi:hypothetical protein